MTESPPFELDDSLRGGLRLPAEPEAAQAARRAVLSSLARFLNIFGDPWSILLLRDVFLGVSRFEAFQSRLGITRQTLYRHVSPKGELRPDGAKLLSRT